MDLIIIDRPSRIHRLITFYQHFLGEEHTFTSFHLDLFSLFHQKGGGCQYYLRANTKLKTQGAIKSYGYENGWDIEDLIKLGRQLRACPYYGSVIEQFCQFVLIYLKKNYFFN